MITFTDLQTSKKGQIGEQIVYDYLQTEGLTVYKPATDTPHAFDFLCHDPQVISNFFVIEVKTYPHRTYYPDIGITMKAFRTYDFVSIHHNFNLCIYFVDQVKKQVYGNSFKKLIRPVTINYNGKWLEYPKYEQLQVSGPKYIYFPLKSMKKLCDIPQKYIEQLKQQSSISQDYKQ